MKGRWMKLMTACMFVAVFSLVGCEGDDGNDGAPGAAGADGSDGLACWDLNGNGVGDFVLDFPPGTEDLNGDGVFDSFDCNAAAGGGGGVANPVESCAVCHSAGSIGDAVAAHALPPLATVTDVVAADDGVGNLVVSYSVLVDGAAVDNFTTMESNYIYTDGDTNLIVPEEDTALLDPESLGGGEYNVTIPGGVALAGEASRFFLRVSDGTTPPGLEGGPRAVVSFDFPAQALPYVASNESCRDCHGEEGVVIHLDPFGYPGMVPSECVTCHADPVWRGFVEYEDSFAGIVHGIHNAHGFPEGFYEYNEEYIYDTTYPSYMNNCSVCHRSDELIAPDGISQLEAANSMPVNAEACFTCHGSTETMFPETDPPDPVGQFHAGITDGCETCHVAGGPASSYLVVTDVHNGAETGNDGIIWDGEDTSVTEGAKFDVRITGVADDGTNLTITWEADYAGAGVNPCNDTVAENAPVFFLPGGGSGGTWSVLRNYAQGDDFILGIDPEAAGQPENVNLTADNTTCSGNVATTVVAVEETDATVGRVGLQGKPGVVSVADSTTFMRVRAKSATYDWVIGSDDAATPRRAIVDTTEKCVKCHVGSLYQHGGNRVDNVDLCILCHNSAANDKYVRVGMGVDASEAYDGQAGELFEMKTMAHGVHASGDAQIPFVIYRGRGIYAWAADESLVPNWPTELDCTYPSGGQDVPGSTVFGSDPDTATVRTCQPHNFHSPTYPRPLNDCGACHVEGFNTLFPDATKAMASTVDAGGDADWSDLIDDVLEGASSASCMSCHKQWSAADRAEYNALGSHAAQNGWDPQAFEEGRQTIIEANQ